MYYEPEIRKCNDCGERWYDSGELECPFCGSDDTEVIMNEFEEDE